MAVQGKSSESIKLKLAGPADTVRLGRIVARRLKPGDFVGLSGALGAGKTTMARAIIHALESKDRQSEVVSPTYTLAQTYETAAMAVAHFDLYRIERERDVEELGLTEALDKGAALVEWPERLGRYAPPDRLTIVFEATPDGRIATVRGEGDWALRLEGLSDEWGERSLERS